MAVDINAKAQKITLRNLSASGVDVLPYRDPVAPAYLKTTSDILNGLEVSVLRFIPRSRHSAILSASSTVDCGQNVQEAIDAIYEANGKGSDLRWAKGRIRSGQTLSLKPGVNIIGYGGKNQQSQLLPLVGLPITLVTNDRTVGDVAGTGDDGLSQRYYRSRIAGMAIQGTTGSFNRAGRAIRLVGAWGFTVEDCLLQGYGIAFELIDCNVTWVTRNQILGGMLCESIADSQIFANQIGPVDFPSMDADRHNCILWITGQYSWMSDYSHNIVYNCPQGITQTITVSAGSQSITCTAHDFIDETPVTLETTGTAPSSFLTPTTDTGWVKVIDANTIKIASSRANYHTSTFLTPGSTGSGTHSLRVGSLANMFINGGANNNTIMGGRVDQSYYSGLMLAGADLNTVSGLIVRDNGRANATGQTGVRLVSADNNVLSALTVDGTPRATGFGTSNQTTGVSVDSGSIGNTLAPSTVKNHTVANIADSGSKTIHVKLKEVSFSALDADVSSGSPALTALTGSRRRAFAFDAASDEIIQLWWEPPKGYASWSIKFRWTNVGAGSGDVVWLVSYEEDAVGFDVSDNEDNNITFTTTALAQDLLNESTPSTRLTLSGDGRQVSIRIKRVATDAADTLSNDAGFISMLLTAYE